MTGIAIVGLGSIFPGANSVESYWRNLVAQRDSTTPLSAAELGVEPGRYYNPVPATPDHICYNHNGHIRDFHFQAEGYRIGADELRSLDPLFQWTVDAAAQAYRDSNAVTGRCGLIIGNIGMPTHSGKRLMSSFYHRMLEPYLRELIGRPDFAFHDYWGPGALPELNLMTGSHNATIAALALGLDGPIYALDAACSSAIYAIQAASYYLREGSVDMMLAGAVCHADHIYLDHGFNILQAFPTDGQSRPFDRASQGLKAGEGAGIVALKRYEDAISAGDHIYGVIEAIGLSNDGGAKHMLLPDRNGQRLALERAYRDCRSDIEYLECHATGTPAGDQVELDTIEEFFGAGQVPLLGGNKANHGHTLTASGMASLIKVLLALKHETIPATLDVDDLVPTPLGIVKRSHIVRENTSWPSGARARRAAINAFGFGGVNGHLVLKEHLPDARPDAGRSPSSMPADAPGGMDICGIGLALPNTFSLEAFENTIAKGRDHFHAVPGTRWMGLEDRKDLLVSHGFDAAPEGAYIEHFDFDCRRFKLPPNVIGSHLMSHAFALPIAERAFRDAGYELDGQSRNIAVIVARDVDHSCYRYQARNEISWQLRDSLNRAGVTLSPAKSAELTRIVKDSLFPTPFAEGITGGVGNIVASRIAAHLKLNGPAFSLCAQESSVFKSLELARFLLADGVVESVIIASAAFCGGIENTLFDRFARNQLQGDGGGAIVLRRAGDAAPAQRVYARLSGLHIHQQVTTDTAFKPSAAAIGRAAENCLRESGIAAEKVGYVECCWTGDDDAALAEVEGLAQVYGGVAATGSAKTAFGHLGAASGLLGLINAMSWLYHRRDGQGGKPRFAAVSGMGSDHAYSHVVLQEVDHADDARQNAAPAIEEVAASPLNIRVHTGADMTIAQRMLSDDKLRPLGRRAAPNPEPAPRPAPRSRGFYDALERQVQRNLRTHQHFLRTENAFIQALRRQLAGESAGVSASQRPIFDRADLETLTDGRVSDVLGPQYDQADRFDIRTRMPSPPYMFVSRITALTAEPGKLKPCTIEWEYAPPDDAWFMCDGKMPAFVALESSHAMIVAFTVIGCDELFKGELSYRAVDSKTQLYDEMPRAGEVLHGRVDIKSFIKVGRNILVAYEYRAFADDRPIFKLEATSGFFRQQDLQRSKGISFAPAQDGQRGHSSFVPRIKSRKTRFDEDDIRALSESNLIDCFGAEYGKASGPRLWAPMSTMLHRVCAVDPRGGAYGLGEVTGEFDLTPDHWAFKAHFKNDPCLPGTLLVEGCEQLLKFYLAYLGLYSHQNLVGKTLIDQEYSAKFRGELKPQHATVSYRLSCKSIRGDLERMKIESGSEAINLTSVVEIIHQGKVIGICDNLGARFVRRTGTQSQLTDAA